MAFTSEKQRQKVMALLNNRHPSNEARAKHFQELNSHTDKIQPLSATATKKRQALMFDKLKDKDSVLTKREIDFIKGTLNRETSKEVGDKMNDAVHDNPDGFKITEEQTEQGLGSLTQSGKRNDLGDREQDVVDNFKEFRLVGFVNGADIAGGGDFYVPQWRVVAKEGSVKGDQEFEYVFYAGKVNVVG